MIDNLQEIIPLMKFESEDDFYYLQILQRKKENALLTSNSRVIKNYYITSIEQLTDYYPEIISLCKKFNARASLRLNKRSFEQTAFQTLKSVTDTILNKDYKSVRRTYDRVCGQFNKEKNKKWIIDVDSKDEGLLTRITTAVKFCEPDTGDDKVYAILKSKSGFHILTKPFNTSQFTATSRIAVEIHKDNPTNLYIP